MVQVDKSQVSAKHRDLVGNMQKEALALAGVFLKISQALKQVEERGGIATVQPQVAFAVGALARLQKDWGAVEMLQSMGATIKPPPR